MKTLRLILIALLLAACGDPAVSETIDDAAESDELGSVEQGMRTWFSPTYAHGVTTGSTMLKCSIGLGAGTGQACMLPSRGIVRYKLVGPSGVLPVDWKQRAQKFFTSDIRPDNYGQPMPFGNAVEEDTANTWVVVQHAACPGSETSNNIYSFACLNWEGAASTVSEDLVGTYKRFQGVLFINIDIDKIKTKVQLHPFAGYNTDVYELVEHALGATLPAAYGQGIYGHDVIYPGRQHPTWSSRFVRNGTTGYEVGGYTVGEMCRMGHWDGQLTGVFGASDQGTCAN